MQTELFDPHNVVVGQEDELFERRLVPAYAATNVFVYVSLCGCAS